MGALFQRIITAINTLATNTASSAVGQMQAPSAPDALQVKASGEMVHVSITHNGPVLRGVQYFTEVSNDPQFSQPIVIHHGASRTSHPSPLPAHDDNGATQTWYFRSYAQYHGSPPSEKTVYGGAENPDIARNYGNTTFVSLHCRHAPEAETGATFLTPHGESQSAAKTADRSTPP